MLANIVLISFGVFILCQVFLGISMSELQKESLQEEGVNVEATLTPFQRRVLNISALSLLSTILVGTFMVISMIFNWIL